MKIRELNLIGFGKFINKRILLRDGINIIYGENEAGKSTLHSFIDGMFYGFLKPYVTRTIYLDTHEKYRPWSGSKYAGTIKFSYDGSDYTIERDFTKGNESTTVLIDSTGEDIVNNIDTGNKGKVYQPGYHFFGFSDAVFSNTISIKQLGSRTDENLASELRDRLTNTSSSLDDNLSVEKAVEDLNKSLKDIGSTRAPTSYYGRVVAELDSLQIERDRILSYKDEYNEILEKSKDLDEKLKNAEKNMENLKEDLEDALIIEKKNIYKKSLSILDEMDELEEKAKHLENYKDISMESYTQGVRLKDGIENLENRQDQLDDDLIRIEDLLKSLDDSESNKELDTRMESDYLEFENLEEEKNKALILTSKTNSEFLKRDYDNMEGKLKTFKLLLLIDLLLALGIGGYGLIKSNFSLLVFSALFFLIAIFTTLRIKNLKSSTGDLKENYLEAERRYNELNEKIEDIEEKQKSILEKYKLESKIEFKKLYSDKQMDIFKAREREINLSENLKKQEQLRKDLAETKLQIENSKKSLTRILEENLSTTIEELKEAMNKKEIYRGLVEEIKTKKLVLDKTLGNHSIEGLEKDLSAYTRNIDKLDINLDSQELKLQIEEKQAMINDLKVKSSGSNERLDILNREVKKLVEIDEEINRKIDLREDLDKRRQALDLAKETIEQLSRDIHKQFAPEINEKVGRIIKTITKGRYDSIRLDDKLNLAVINPDDKQLIAIDSLSGGTIDQLYFSLRFGITDTIGQKQPPLILDDCFIQYDNSRLSNMMEYLSELGESRQIILFTCHKREYQSLNAMGKDFNLIDIS